MKYEIDCLKCNTCGKWAGAHATLPGQPTDHLCMCVAKGVEMTAQTAEQLAEKLHNPYMGNDAVCNHAAAMLRSQAAEIVSLETTIERLKNANTMLDAALIASHPRGAEGRVFDLWNAARAALGDGK